MDENRNLNCLYPTFCKVLVILTFIIVGACAGGAILLGVLDYLIMAKVVSPLQL